MNAQDKPPENEFLILLVEDEESDALLLQRALKRHGVQGRVQWMKDGLDALHYLEGEGSSGIHPPFPHIIILDLRMPRMSGLEFLAWFRDQTHLRSIPIVVMSSSTSNTDIQKAYALGAHSYTVKPADFGSLVKTVKITYDQWLTLSPTR